MDSPGNERREKAWAAPQEDRGPLKGAQHKQTPASHPARRKPHTVLNSIVRRGHVTFGPISSNCQVIPRHGGEGVEGRCRHALLRLRRVPSRPKGKSVEGKTLVLPSASRQAPP